MSHPILKVTGTADLRAEELSAGLEAKTHRLGRGCPRDKPQDPAHLALKMRRWPLPGHHTRRARPPRSVGSASQPRRLLRTPWPITRQRNSSSLSAAPTPSG